MGRIDFFRGLLSGAFLLLLSTPGFSQNSSKTIVVSGRPAQSISVHELSMPFAARSLVSSGERKLSHDKNPQAAIKEFQSATKKAPGYYEAFYLTGVAYLCLQNQSAAEKSFHQAAELSQYKYSDAVIALGTMMLDRGEISGGEKLLQKALELEPRAWRAHYELARLEVSRGHLPAALDFAQKARIEAPQKPAVFQLLAVIHQREADYSALLDDLDGYIQLDPDSSTGVWARQLRVQTQQQIANSRADVVDARK
jgi:tetratricopeptide (TPR) repeat protein